MFLTFPSRTIRLCLQTTSESFVFLIIQFYNEVDRILTPIMRRQNPHEIKPLEFITLVSCIMLLTAVAIDIMLPAFDKLRDYFGLGQDSTATAQIVTFFFIGQIGQIIYGPLSDRYGRLLILRVGFALYIGGLVAAP